MKASQLIKELQGLIEHCGDADVVVEMPYGKNWDKLGQVKVGDVKPTFYDPAFEPQPDEFVQVFWVMPDV